ncbi:MAG: hypothetical protein KBC36_10685 [Spirochaetia bacterium]|nr:hypothetical protein [Spirochaetia bacterium]
MPTFRTKKPPADLVAFAAKALEASGEPVSAAPAARRAGRSRPGFEAAGIPLADLLEGKPRPGSVFPAGAGTAPAGPAGGIAFPELAPATAAELVRACAWDTDEGLELARLAGRRLGLPAAKLADFLGKPDPAIARKFFLDRELRELFIDRLPILLCCCGCCDSGCCRCPWRPCPFARLCRRPRVLVQQDGGTAKSAYKLVFSGPAVSVNAYGVATIDYAPVAGTAVQPLIDASIVAHADIAAAHGNFAPASHTTEANPHPGKFAAASHDAYHDAHNDARYAPKSADPNGYADKGDLDGKAPKVWDATTPTADVPSGYAKASDLTAKAPKVWDATTPAGDVPSGYAPATGSAEYAPAKDSSSNPIHYLAKGAGTPSNGIELANASDGTKAADVSTVLHASNAYESSGAVTAHAAIPGAHGDFASAGHAHQLGDGTLTGFPSTLPLNALSGISSIAARNAAVPLEVPIAGLGAVDAKIRAFATVHLRTTASGANSPYFVAQVQAGNGGTKLLVSVQDATGAAPNTNDSFFDGKTFQVAWMATQVS